MPNELHTMPVKCEAFLSSTRVRNMQADEAGIFALLLIEGWLKGARLPNDLPAIRRMLRIRGERQWRRIRDKVIAVMFEPTPDGKYLVNVVSSELFAEVQAELAKHSAAGRKGAEARWAAEQAKRAAAEQEGNLPTGPKSELTCSKPESPNGQVSAPASTDQHAIALRSQCDRTSSRNAIASPASPPRSSPLHPPSSPPSTPPSIHSVGSKDCSEPAETPGPEPPVLTWPLVGKQGEFEVTVDMVKEWAKSYPGINTMVELRKCRQWNIDNPKRRKTRGGIRRHIGTWLSKAQDRAGPTPAESTGPRQFGLWTKRDREETGKDL